jgi:hypothetical protein
MISPELHKHLEAETAHMVKEMLHAGLNWAEIVETLESLVQAQLWHVQGFLSWWLG